MSREIVTAGHSPRTIDAHRYFVMVGGVSYLMRSSGWHGVVTTAMPDGTETKRSASHDYDRQVAGWLAQKTAPVGPDLAAFVAPSGLTCKACKGTMRTECEECRGAGTVDRACAHCDDHTHECTCDDCEGEGWTECDECCKADPAHILGGLFDRRLVHDTIVELGGVDAAGCENDAIAGTLFLRYRDAVGVVMGIRHGTYGNDLPRWEMPK